MTIGFYLYTEDSEEFHFLFANTTIPVKKLISTFQDDIL